MSKLYYICKYTPTELLEAMGAECVLLDGMTESFSEAERCGHPNLCGYGKAILEKVLTEGIRELILVNCCDTIRSVYDILHAAGKMDFLYFLDLVHDESECGAKRMAFELDKLVRAYREYSGNDISPEQFAAAFSHSENAPEDFIGILGARASGALAEMIGGTLPLPVRNLTCVSGRTVEKPEEFSLESYAKALISQIPCMRMNDVTGRKMLYSDPHLKAVVYHTVKFCDYYGFEYADLQAGSDVPILKLETDYTLQSAGQLSTRLEAFSEQLLPDRPETMGAQARTDGTGRGDIRTQQKKENENMTTGYFAGIDSGSTSTKAVIIDADGKIISSAMLPTGAKVSDSSLAALEKALKGASLSKNDLENIVTTGYGRKTVSLGGSRSVTEISCHAKGAHALDPGIRAVIDIGGQDSKVICVDENGSVTSFAMNDKCAAGTGRFLEMTGRALGLSLEEMAERGIKWKENIAISNTCTVFAESEIISLVAEEKSLDDIVHGLNRSVAVKISSLIKRAGASGPYMMTGGVAQNRSVIKALEEMLDCEVRTSPYAQYCGAYGAALYARG